ncbi:MAG: chaperonin GroEL, partial [Acidobacteriota bacterium]
LESMKLDVADEQVGVNIVKRALQEPVRQIAVNAGHEGAVIVGKILEKKDLNYGFNADTEVFGDLVKDGVIDPTMVTRTAIQNAASIASLLLTTEALVTELPEKEQPAPPGGGHDMGGMGGMY